MPWTSDEKAVVPTPSVTSTPSPLEGAMNYSQRVKLLSDRASRRGRKEAVERIGDTPEQISLGKFIARATGTTYAPLAQLSRNDGGGVMYAHTFKQPNNRDEVAQTPGSYGRMPLVVKRDQTTGLYDIAR